MLVLEGLKRLGCRVEPVSNAQEAVYLFKHAPRDMILMDCDMPVIDEFEVTRVIRELEAPGIHVPIIAMTALALHGYAERCLAAGTDDFISKPLSPT